MNYLAYMAALPAFTGKGCVDELKSVLKRMGEPQQKIKCIHVAGTNGKGSVCAMLEHALYRAGYRTGLFTSPYLVRFNERIRVNGQEIDDETLELSAQRVHKALMGERITQFGFVTAMMFDIFWRLGVEIAVIEAGMGGGTDPTVLCSPLASVITGIQLDHTSVLGETLEQIASEKAGIIKPGVPAVLGLCDDGPARVIEERAKAQGADLVRIRREDVSGYKCGLNGTEFLYRQNAYKLSLLGEYQIWNGAAAAACLSLLNEKGVIKARSEDIGGAVWPGRLDFKRINGREALLDGAHNPAGAQALADFLIKYAGTRKIIMITAVMRDKDYLGLCRELARAASAAVAVNVSGNNRALPSGELKKALAQSGVRAYEAEGLNDGLKLAESLDKDALTVICGSLYLVGEALAMAEGNTI